MKTEPVQSVRRHRLRRAYVLIMVLGLAVVITTLGISFIESNMTAMPAAMNLKHALRAQYLAESGVELGKHFLLYPPTTVPLNDYWRGQNNVAVDATSDYTNIQVSQHATLKDRFKIIASGLAKGFDGTVRGKKTITVEVLLPHGQVWDLPYGLLGKSATTSIPSAVKVSGNLHGNGSVTGTGSCTGKVSASLTALWLGGGPPTSVVSLAPAVAMPVASTTPYQTYTLRGVAYAARLFDASGMSSAEATALNAIDMIATNPGRIILAKSGNFKMSAGAVLNGTLLVTGGRLDIEGNVTITAQPGFPAIVCAGPIEFSSKDSALQVTGAILCTNIDEKGKGGCSLTARGVTILTNNAQVNGLLSSFQFIYDLDRCWFYNFESAPTRQPITVLSHKED